MLISGINAIKMALMTICKPEQDKKNVIFHSSKMGQTLVKIDKDVV